MLNAVGILLAATLAGLCGCETIDRARQAQKDQRDASLDVPAAYTSAPPATISLKGMRLVDYVAFAVTNRPDLEVSRLAVSNAVLELAQVTSDRELRLGLSGGYSQSTANGTSHFSWHQNRGRATTDFTFDLLICDFGRIDARERQARENLVGARRDLDDAEFAVFNEVAGSYFALLRNDALLEVARTNEFQYAEHLRQAESLFKAGETKKLDVLKARVDLSDARLATINASNEVLTAAAGFMRALGLDDIHTRIPDLIEYGANALETPKPTLNPSSFGVEEALCLARTNSPSILTLRSRLRAASAEVDYRIANLMPEITLSSAFAFADPAWNWSWGFKAIQTVLDGKRRERELDMAVLAMESAKLDVDRAEQQLSHDLAVAAANRDNARESLATAKVEVQQALENLDTVKQQYSVGDASRLDFTDAASALASALGTRVKAFYAAEIAEAELIRLTGHVPSKPSNP